METFDVRFRRRPADVTRVRVGPGALARLGEDLATSFPSRPAFVVSDSNVAPLHGTVVLRDLERRGLVARLLTFPAGEASKTRETKAALENRLLELGAGRDAVIVAVGGGVTGDLAGFLAATWQRGVPLVQAPTSLLSMVDAALGGKTGVDLPSAKNVVGAFHQPWGVYADVDTLRTLPRSDRLEGLAEVVKTAAVADADLFRRLESGTASVERIVVRCLAIKARLVARDERDVGPRVALNFGHTVGHALEAASGWGLSHGRAVAVGLAVESRLAVRRSGLTKRACRRILSLLEALGLVTGWPEGGCVDDVVEATRRDKKAVRGVARYALPARIGAMPSGSDPTVEIGESDLRTAIEEHRSESAGRD